MKRFLIGLVALSTVPGFAHSGTSLLETVEEAATKYYGLTCIQDAGSLRCSGESPRNGFVVTETLKKDQSKVSFDVFGDVNGAFNRSRENLLGSKIIDSLVHKAEKEILIDGSCSKFQDGNAMVGTRRTMTSKCLNRSGQEVKVKVVYKDQLNFISASYGWDSNGTYVKRVIVKH